MIKYVANTFLATRISFINEVAQLCEAMGVDVDDVVAGVGPGRPHRGALLQAGHRLRRQLPAQGHGRAALHG